MPCLVACVVTSVPPPVSLPSIRPVSSAWRHDPLTGRTVRVAAERAQRPSDFDEGTRELRCPFCAGAESDTPPEIDRLGDGRGGWLSRVVPNRYPIVEGDAGAHEVLVESPRHVTRFVDLTAEEAAAAVQMWFRRIEAWRSEASIERVVWFKNEGPAAGASLAHVHSQLVALRDCPVGASPPVRFPSAPIEDDRLVWQDDRWRVVAAPGPRFACEAWLIPVPKEIEISSIATDASLAASLAEVLRRLIGAAMAATNGSAFNLTLPIGESPDAWRIELTPRVSQIAGFELSTGLWINAVSPEQAAKRLRERFAD